LVTLILLKSVTTLPEIDWVALPLNTTVPVPLLKVPLFAKLPAKLRVAGALNVPEMVTFFKVGTIDPSIEEVPLNTTVPLLCVNVALLVRSPVKVKEPDGAVKVPVELVILEALTLVELENVPLLVILPATVSVADEPVNVPLLVILAMFKAVVGAVIELLVFITTLLNVADPPNATVIGVVPPKVEVFDPALRTPVDVTPNVPLY